MVSYKNTRLKHSELIKLISSIPEVLEWYTITGNYSVLLKLATSSSQRLAALIVKLEEFGETNTSLILEQNQDRKIIGSLPDPMEAAQ
jgi:Lrp/AsnC family leucine-responsive transcriptional regulator